MSDKPTLDMETGSTEWVRYLQQVMQTFGYWLGDTDGVFGEELEQAVRALQDGNGLTQSGVVDDEVWTLLERLEQRQAPAVQEDQQASASESSGHPVLRKGAGTGEWVQYLQQVMQSLGYWLGTVDGVFGDELEHAVRTLQSGNALVRSGVVDDGTWTLLDQLLASPSPAGAAPAQARHAASIPVDPGLTVTAGGLEYVIYTDEVRQGGSASWRARNPGNIRNGEAYGAYPGKHINAGASGHFAVFPDEATGFAAIKSVLRHYGHVTVAQAVKRYAPSSDGNDPVAYARHVAGQMGVPVTTYVDELSDDQMTVFATAIRHGEGWTVGHTFALTDVSLPDAVKKAINGS